MKRLRKSITASSGIDQTYGMFTASEVASFLSQIEELKGYPVSLYDEGGVLQFVIGDSIYTIVEANQQIVSKRSVTKKSH